MAEEPFLEMWLSCTGLPADGNGKPPNSFLSVCLANPPEHAYFPYAHTEIIDVSTLFLFFVMLGKSN